MHTQPRGRMIIPAGQDYASKPAWRQAVRECLKALPDDHIMSQSTEACERLRQLQVYKDARSISIFMSMPQRELQTGDIVTDALRSGKLVYIPFIRKKSTAMDMLRLRDEDDFNALKPDGWGIPSLDPGTADNRENCLGHVGFGPEQSGDQRSGAGLDIVFMPGVAFDEGFDRLGHGRGYYDKFLARYFESKTEDGSSYRKPYLIGLALQEQIVPPPHRLPVNSWDFKVDAILAGSELRVRRTLSLAAGMEGS